MKLIARYTALFLGLLLVGSCKKNEDQAPGFDMIYQTEFTIQAGLGVDVVHHYYLKNIATRYQQFLTEHNVKDADITKIIPAQIVMNGIFGDSNYDFIEEATLRIYKEPDATKFTEIAYRFPIPLEPGNTLALIPNLPDIKPYLTDARYSLDLGLRLRKITQEETQTRMDIQFRAVF
jgi:hypothetical protein